MMISKKNITSPLILVFSVSFLLYVNTLGHDHALDDTMMITENSFTRQGLAGLGDILANDAFVGFFGEEKTLLEGGRYRPLSQVTFAIEYELFGLDPFIGHLVNTLLYAFLCCLIFLTLRRLFPYGSYKTRWYYSLPFIITILYVLHPLHSEAVANIKGRDELMSMFFSIATLWFYLDLIEKKNKKAGLLAGICFLLALLSKENAITFVAVIPLTVHYFSQYPLNENLKKIYVLLIPLVVFFFLRYKALGFFLGTGTESGELLNNPFLHASVSEKYATIIYTLGIYLKLLFLPHPLTHDYYPKYIPITGWDNPLVILSLLAYIVLAAIAIKSLKTKHPVGYGILFYLLTLSIVSNLFVSIGTFMNERFLFMPSLGFAIVAGYFLHKALTGELLKVKAATTIAVLLSAFIILGFSYKTVTRNMVWKDDHTLFTTDVKTSANSAKVNVSAGGALIEKALKPGTMDYQKVLMLLQAVEYLEHGLTIHPGYVAGWLLLGNAGFHLGNYENSLAAYLECLRINPGYNYTLTNLSMLGKKARQEDELIVALKSFEKLAELQPQNAEHVYQLALVYEKKELFDKTTELLKNVVYLDSNHYLALRKLGEIEGKIFGNLNSSINYLNRALAIAPNDATTLENLGVAHGIAGELEMSLLYFYKALEQNPDNAQLLGNISLTYRRMGNVDKAEEYAERRRGVVGE